MRRATLPLMLWLLVGTPAVPSAQETAAEPSGEANEAAPDPTPAEIQGPLFHVTTGDDPVAEDDPGTGERQEVVDIYIESEDPFLAVFWWWVVGIAGLAGVGALLWWIWGRRQPKRASRL